MPDDFDHDEFSRRELAYIAWRRTLSWEIQDVEDAELAIQAAFRYAWKMGKISQEKD